MEKKHQLSCKGRMQQMTETVTVKVGIGELNGLSGIVMITLACIDKEVFSY